jgi:hypothetical protein
MNQQEIKYLKNITIDDIVKFYPEVTEEDFQMIKIIIECDVLKRVNDFSSLTNCLIFVLEETSKTLLDESRGMKSIYRDILIDNLLNK